MTDKKTVEEWATAAGMLPELQPATGKAGQFKIATKRANPKAGLFKNAKTLRRWPEGFEVTQAEFDEAVEEANGVIAR